jgi:hypothetical protein
MLYAESIKSGVMRRGLLLESGSLDNRLTIRTTNASRIEQQREEAK